MILTELLTELSEKGIKLWLDGDKLGIRAPKGSLTQELRLLLQEHKNDILELLRRQGQTKELTDLPLVPVFRDKPIPLSLEQQRLWMLNQWMPKNATHNIVQAIRFSGILDIELLKCSLNDIGHRHEALRTTFPKKKGNPVQQIGEFKLVLDYEDYSQITESQEDLVISQLADDEAKRLLDIYKGPLWRFKLAKFGSTNHVLFIVFHHLSGDIFSANLLIRELAVSYETLLKGQIPELERLSVQYADFSVWQKHWLEAGHADKHIEYWKRKLKGTSFKLDMPKDHSDRRDLQGNYHTFRFPKESWELIKKISMEKDVTVAVVLLTAFNVLLHHFSGEEDIVVGVPTSGRSNAKLASLIGFFAYPLLIRSDLSENPSFEHLLVKVRKLLIEAQIHQNVPFSKVMEVLRSENEALSGPRVLFSTFLGNQLKTIKLPNLLLTPISDASRAPSDLDLLWSMYEVDGELCGTISYRSSLFDSDTIQYLVDSYLKILSQCMASPDSKLSDFDLIEALRAKIDSPRPKIAISATFTAESMDESLKFWVSKLNLPYQIQFAQYNQIFQELLLPDSLFSNNTLGVNVILIRFVDWLRFDEDHKSISNDIPTPEIISKIKKNIDDFASALQSKAKQSTSSYLVCLCPSTSSIQSEKVWTKTENHLITALQGITGVYLTTPNEIAQMYPLPEYYDPHSDKIGHIPFTPTYFSSLSTLIIRKILATKRSAYKVIVLDCDNTLWQGVCGEDGADGVKVTDAFKELQRFVLKQYEKGMLVCLCSKNSEEDVRQVFNEHPDMLLRWEHLVSWRINWQPKSENIRSIAEELQLGLDSFIFLDDNPVECAEVRAQCPAVLTLQVPENSKNIERFLSHNWAFDRLKVTEEDQRRSQFYQQNSQRQEVMQSSLTLGEFVKGLDLKVDMCVMVPELYERVSQLTQRTNQFNANKLNLSVGEIKALCDSRDDSCFVVTVKDRFGDYGLVGVMLANVSKSSLIVDTFLLSCRTLGRGVEHQMLSGMGKIAQDKGLEKVTIIFKKTDKNQPVHNFLNAVENATQETLSDQTMYTLSTEEALKVNFSAATQELSVQARPASTPTKKPAVATDLYEHIANDLSTPDAIRDAIQEQAKMNSLALNSNMTRPPIVEPSSDTEKVLASLWSEVFGLEKVGIHDNFFQLGGNSLMATQAVSRLRKKLTIELQLQRLLEFPTIEALGNHIDEHLENNDDKIQAPAIIKVSRESRKMKRSQLKRDDELNK